jgi:hypothetical protein
MKKLILFLIFISVVQMCYNINLISAQEGKDKEAQEIKRVIENFLMDFSRQDLDSMMNQVSIGYSDVGPDGNIIDYAQYKTNVKNLMENRFKTYIDYSINVLNVLKLDIQENKATIEFEFKWQGFNLDTLKDDSEIHKGMVSLAKENGSWKITQYKY